MHEGIAIIGILALHIPLARDIGKLHSYYIPVKKIIRCLKGLSHKVLDVMRIYPCGTDTHLDLRSIQLFGLHSLKGCHVYRKLRMILRIVPCYGKFLPDIPGQILIRSLPSVHQWILEYYSGKLFGDLILALACKSSHIRQIHLCFFR